MIRLTVSIRYAEGALQRTLGTLEHRGFRVETMQVERHQDTYLLTAEVQGERDPALVCRQLERLYDVQSATFAQSAAA